MTSQYFVAVGALAALLLYLVQKMFSSKSNFWKKYGVPNFKTENFFLRTWKGYSWADLDCDVYKEMGDLKYVGINDSGVEVCFVKDLDIAKNVYIKDFDHFVNRMEFGAHDKLWNEMLLNKVDKEWRDLRATMSPTFSTGKIRRMFPLLKESADKFSSYVKKIVEKSGKIDVEDALGRYCMDGICSIAFGIDSGIFKNENSIVADKAKQIRLQFDSLAMLRIFFFSLLPEWMQKFQPPIMNKEASDFFSKRLKDSILHREKTGERRNDFLQLMIDAKHGQLSKDDEDDKLDVHEKDAKLNDKNKKEVNITNDLIVANCLLFILGGYDTTLSAVIFASYALALNPDIQEKLRNDLQNAIEENDGEFSYDICNTHEYLEKFTTEVFRMYPPGVRMERLCNKDYQIPGTKSVIPKGSAVYIPAYQIHHDAKYFPDPQKFDPERFSPEQKSKRHPYAYMTFGQGPRNCIANRFAMVQTKAAIAGLVLNFDLQPTAKTPIPLKMTTDNASQKPKENLCLKLTPRN